MKSSNKLLFCFIFVLVFITGCNVLNEESKKSEVSVDGPTISMPEGIPSFVADRDFKEIDWNRTATEFDTGTGKDMFGYKDKIGIIGQEFKADQVEKWMWHIWLKDTDKAEMTVVGYHQDSSKIIPVFSDGAWSKEIIGGVKVNDADLSTPSNVILPDNGKWAFLVYLDGKWFDTMIIDFK